MGTGRGLGVLFCVQVLPLGFFARVRLRVWVCVGHLKSLAGWIGPLKIASLRYAALVTEGRVMNPCNGMVSSWVNLRHRLVLAHTAAFNV